MDSQKPTRDEAMLVSMAETVGSTLGALAAKANAVQKALTPGALRSKPRVAKRAKTMKKRKPARKRTGAGRGTARQGRARRSRGKS